MAYVDRDRSRETALSSVAAVVLVGGIGFGLVTGLAMTVAHRNDPLLTIHNWAMPAPPPPPRPQTLPQNHGRVVAVPTPARTIVPPLAPETTITLPTSDLALEGSTVGVANTQTVLPPPPVDRSSRAAPRSDPNGWVTTDDYPAAALRAGQQGTTGFRLDIGVDGRATGCTVTTSSGSQELDQATCRLLLRRARFEPAHDAGGAPIVANYSGRIAWRAPAD